MLDPASEIDQIQVGLTRALAGTHRLRLVRLLGERPMGVRELADALHLPQATVSQNLGAMRSAGDRAPTSAQPVAPPMSDAPSTSGQPAQSGRSTGMNTQSLPRAAHAHHERLLGHVNGIPVLADALLAPDHEPALAGIADLRAFMTGTLVPHMEAAERALYPELERMFQNRHSMAPMRREHDRIRSLVAEFGAMVDRDGGALTLGRTLAMRRVLFQLYALLKVHVAEEEAYLRIVEHGVPDDVAEAVTASLAHPVIGG